jgi:4'-phosphopantetheinyl transferase
MVAMNNQVYRGVLKDEYGRPFLNELPGHISLSHSYPYVAAQIANTRPVGIDLEQPKQKLLRVAGRVLNPAELSDAGKDVAKTCIYWCAKEALYKIHGKGSLVFSRDLFVQPFQKEMNGVLKGYIRVDEGRELFTLHYSVERDFVLVFTK